MVFGLLTFLYGKLGRFYPATYLTLELQSAFGVTIGTLALLSIYYDALSSEWLPIGGIAIGTTAIAIAINLIRTYPQLRPISAWIKGERSQESAERAWTAAVGLPLELIKRDLWVPILIVVIPTAVAAVLFADLPTLSFIPIASAALVAVGYGGVLHYLLIETGMRPVLLDISEELPSGPKNTDVPAISLRFKLLATLPLINIITAFVVRALATENASGPGPEFDFMIAVAIATAISLELTVMLSKSITNPIADLQHATREVSEGRYDVSVPVTTGDEIGELAASFNEMAAGLAERERIREAFGTYLDEEVAEYILSEDFPDQGEEVEVTVLICDVVNFTEFARSSEARDVVACLNELFETAVPIIARHGGHVDKFVGDGLLAVFGAPQRLPDHSDRALRAALEITARVNEDDRAPFRIGVGLNTGRVVAGAIGGGGRLNFSVIGDPVNVAARVESATRDTGDHVLVTEATAAALTDRFELTDRGEVELKGIDEPVRLLAPAVGEAGAARPEPSPVPGTLVASSAEEQPRGLRRFF